MDIHAFAYNQRLDVDFLQSIYEDDTEHAAISFEQFLLKYPAQLKEVEDSFTAGDLGTFKQKLHKLKPVFSYVGLTVISAQAEKIEKQCNEIHDLNVISGQYVDLKRQLNEFIPIIEAELERLKT
jgi:HPt (histidine-containing phosphotransfer) domain-containing protein